MHYTQTTDDDRQTTHRTKDSTLMVKKQSKTKHSQMQNFM